METIWCSLLRIYINVSLAHERIILDRSFFLLTSIAIQSCQDERIGSDQIGVLVVLVDFVLVAKIIIFSSLFHIVNTCRLLTHLPLFDRPPTITSNSLALYSILSTVATCTSTGYSAQTFLRRSAALSVSIPTLALHSKSPSPHEDERTLLTLPHG